VRRPRAEPYTPLSGGSGHHARRHYDRCVGCDRVETGFQEKTIASISDRGGDITDDMKDEYDFSKAERGRFFRPDAKLVPPPNALAIGARRS